MSSEKTWGRKVLKRKHLKTFTWYFSSTPLACVRNKLSCVWNSSGFKVLSTSHRLEHKVPEPCLSATHMQMEEALLYSLIPFTSFCLLLPSVLVKHQKRDKLHTSQKLQFYKKAFFLLYP
jgi:hypothetical protein